MKMSKREKRMLLVLGIFGIVVLYYQCVYTALVNKVEEKTNAKNQIEQNYNKAMDTIKSLDTQKSRVKMLKAKIDDESAPFYPTISQEYIILELDKLIKDSGLEGGMTFEPEEVKKVDPIKKSDKDKDLSENSFQGDVDNYNENYGEAIKENVNINSRDSNKSDQQGVANAKNKNNGNSAKDPKSGNENTVTQMKVNIDFNGSYENVVKFIKALKSIGEDKRSIPVYAIDMSMKSLGEVKGSANMVIYSVPKIDDELSNYVKWDKNNTYGKSEPFTINSAVGTGIKSDADASDFLFSVNSAVSDLPTIIIGKANDTLRTTYAYGDGNNEQNAEIVLNQKDNKYYYKYKIDNNKVPVNYDDLGNEFVPNSENIVLNMSSEVRVSSNDKSGLKLKVINNTDKLVMVNISGDDTENPRISIDGDSKNISVNQK